MRKLCLHDLSPSGIPAPDEISLRDLPKPSRVSWGASRLGRRGDDSTVPASASPGVEELAIVPDAGRDVSTFRAEGGESVVSVDSSGSIV